MFHTHPSPNSLAVEAALQMSKGVQVHSTTSDKEKKLLDAVGRKIFSSTTLAMHISNSEIVMERYRYSLWGKDVIVP